MTERRYVAEYRWDDRAWIVQFRDPDIATFGRTLAAAKRYARSALAVHLDVEDLREADAVVVNEVLLPDEVEEELGELAEQRSLVDRLRAEVAESTRRAARDLRARGFSTRDVGEILGISGSRVARIDRESRAG
jgi:DNA-directed RNA polymerase specialized sigma subunit